MSIEQPVCVGALVLNAHGRIFVQRRSMRRRVLPGIWDIVGGHVECGETLQHAMAREIHEETGWTLRHIGVQVADWEWEHAGIIRREIDYLVDVEGNLMAPRLEVGKHDIWAWVGMDNLALMMEGRRDGDSRLRDVVAKALQITNTK